MYVENFRKSQVVTTTSILFAERFETVHDNNTSTVGGNWLDP